MLRERLTMILHAGHCGHQALLRPQEQAVRILLASSQHGIIDLEDKASRCEPDALGRCHRLTLVGSRQPRSRTGST